MNKQVAMFDDFDHHALAKMNEFMKKHEVVDVKMNTVVAVTGNFFTRYLVIYKEGEPNATHEG